MAWCSTPHRRFSGIQFNRNGLRGFEGCPKIFHTTFHCPFFAAYSNELISSASTCISLTDVMIATRILLCIHNETSFIYLETKIEKPWRYKWGSPFYFLKTSFSNFRMPVGYINYDICIMHKSELQCLLIDPLYFSFYLNTCISDNTADRRTLIKPSNN